MRQNNYGDIKYKDLHPSMVESLKATSAKTLADEISYNRGEYKDHQDENEAVRYLEELGWYYDYENRAWRYGRYKEIEQ